MIASHKLCLAAAVSAVLINTGCSRKAEQTEDMPIVQENWSSMSTFASVSLPGSNESDLPSTAALAKKSFALIEKQANYFDPESELSAINAAAGKAEADISAELQWILNLSVRYSALSGGTFDPTVVPLMKLWGFRGGPQLEKAPGPEMVKGALSLVGWQEIELGNGTVKLKKPGMALDLGAIAKGFAVDIAFEKLVANGNTDFMIDLGGNIRCQGSPRGDEPWRIGIRNPFARSTLLGTIELTDGMAVATSGNYERFVEIDGIRYAHIIDASTGYPVRGMAGVTVVAPSAADADALSTSLFILGVKKGTALVEEMADCHAMFVEDSDPPNIVMTPGFKKFFVHADQ